MTHAIRQRMRDRDEGFTLIELLVVVIIIGILAAIAIPTFLNQRERGWEAAAQSDVRNAAIAQQSYFTQNPSIGYTSSNTDLEDHGWVASGDVTLVTDGDTDSYCIMAAHDSGGDAFQLFSDSGTVERISPAPGTITCSV